jgi:integrase/recombinase XerD
MKELTRQPLKNWFDKIRAERDYSEKTLNAIKSELNWLFRPLVDDGLLEESPLSKVKFKNIVAPRRPRVVMSIEEVHEILRNAETFSPDGLFPFLATLVHTGARRSEIRSLTREDIDFKTALIHIKKSKNGRERFIRMSPMIDGILRTHMQKNPGGALFQNEDGSKLAHDHEVARLITKFKAFFPIHKNWGCHSLRHSFAYNFLMKGGQMYQLQAILGHRSIDVTVDLYGQLQAQDILCPSPYEPING